MVNYEELEQIAKNIWDHPELKFQEQYSSNILIEYLKAQGFEVKDNLADIPTAFSASFGSGGPHIGFLGEFDALSDLSQVPDKTCKEALEEGGSGHGCGHHLLGVGSMEAAIRLKNYIEENNIKARVSFFGCPGEEGGSGKAFMVKAGVFDDVDIALTWHPFNHNHVMTGSLLANIQTYVSFKGVSSHAAGSPQLGRSALDALELTNVGIQFLREHMDDTDRIHYSIIDGGSKSPNVVQAYAQGLYLVRSKDNESVIKLNKRLEDIVKGAALMSGVDYEINFDKACSNIIPNAVLEDVLYNNFVKAGPCEYTEEEIAYAESFKKNFPEENFKGQFILSATDDPQKEIDYMKTRPLNEKILEHKHKDIVSMGSSDVGDVSNVVPTAQISVACYAMGTNGHSWEQVAQGKSSVAMKGMHKAGEVLYLSAVDLLENPELIEKAKEEFLSRTKGKFVSPIPDGKKPNIV